MWRFLLSRPLQPTVASANRASTNSIKNRFLHNDSNFHNLEIFNQQWNKLGAGEGGRGILNNE